MILIAYLRDGRVYADKEAWEHGLDHASYRVLLTEPPVIETRIAGVDYTSMWCWDIDAKHPYGAVPLIRAGGD